MALKVTKAETSILNQMKRPPNARLRLSLLRHNAQVRFHGGLYRHGSRASIWQQHVRPTPALLAKEEQRAAQ